MAIPRGSQQTLARALSAIWSKFWLVALIAIVCPLTAYLYSSNQTALYEASTRLMYDPPADVSNPSSGVAAVNTDTMAIQLQSVGSSLQDPNVVKRAKDELSSQDASLRYTVEATIVVPDSTTTNATFPNMVEVVARTTDPNSAAAIANAYAAAVIAQRKESQEKRFQTAQRVVRDQLSQAQSKLTAEYAILVQQLQNLQIAEASATGDFVVVVPAKPPKSPVSPQPLRSAALGLIGGVLVGVALVFGISRFDTRIKSHRDVAKILQMPVLGRIPKSREVGQPGELSVVKRPDSPVSESLRMIRGNLEWGNIDGDVRTILFTSCMKGEGKTTVVCNLAMALAGAGKRVVVVDGDLRAPRVHRVYNISNSVGLTSLVLGTTSMSKALQQLAVSEPRQGSVVITTQGNEAKKEAVKQQSRLPLQVLASGPLPPDPGELVASHRMGEVLEEIRAIDADYVLVDAPPIMAVGDAAALSAHVDGVIVVVNVEKARVPMLTDGYDALTSLPCRKIGAIVVGEKVDLQHYYYS